MSGTTRNDGAWAAARSGVPVSFHKAGGALIPTKRVRMKLMNGIEVDKLSYESFSDHIKAFAGQVATMPHQVPHLTQQLGHRLMQMHVNELQQYGQMLSAKYQAHYDKPHIDRWEAHRSEQRKRVVGDSTLSTKKSLNVVELYRQAHGDGAADNFRRMASATGCGDMPEMHKFLNFIHDKLGLRGEDDRPPGTRPKAGSRSAAKRLYGDS